MVRVRLSALLLLTSCGSPNRLAQESLTDDGASRIAQTTVAEPAVVMLRSSQSENGFYGKEVEAEINQILRFLEN